MDQLNISYTGLLTLAGAGSLAGAFAAKDIVQNIFGGLVIFFDQPFKVGDAIASSDQKIAGTVEHIGWRVTELVNFQKEPIIVPNGAFISMIIINRSKMKARLFNEVINLRYQDFEKVPALINAIGDWIKQQDYVDGTQKQYVHLTAFAPHSIDLMVRCTFSHPSRDLFLQHKEQLLLDIGKIVDQHGAAIAFPTYTLHHSEQGGEQQAT
jgi:MscS family membrane protein